MNDLPVIGYSCLRRELWDRQGANICIVKSCFDVKKNDFGERSMLFRRPSIANESRQHRHVENASPRPNNRELCIRRTDKPPRLREVYFEIYIAYWSENMTNLGVIERK